MSANKDQTFVELTDQIGGSVIQAVAALITAIRNAGPPIYGAAFIATSLLLFLPKAATARLGLTDLIESNRAYLGGVLLISGSLLAVYVMSFAARYFMGKIEEWTLMRDGRQKLSELTEAEKQFLRPYIVEGQNTQYTSIANGVAKGLEMKTLIFRSANVSVGGVSFPYNLQPYVRRLLIKNPSLLD